MEIEPSLYAFLVMLLSMAVDVWRSRALGSMARKYDSQALEADALHFSTDIWSSAVVIFGLALVWAGRSLPHGMAASGRSDCGFVCRMCGRFRELAAGAENDGCAAGRRARRHPQPIHDRIGTVDGVLEVERVRIRKAGKPLFRGCLGGPGAQFDVSTVGASFRCCDERECARFCRMPT